MGVTNSNKIIDTTQIGCDGSVQVTLALTAAPDIVSHPTDIVLVLDRSGSMQGTPLANMKKGAKTFIRIIQEATGGVPTGQIGFGSRIGIVSFSDTAVADTQLITDVDTLNSAVDGLTAGGRTNHADAFTKAVELFEPQSGSEQIIVLFTDGNTTAGGPPAPVAAAAKAQGIIIYCIGLVGTGGVDVNALNEWASDPDASHVAVTPDEADLEQLFADLAANVTKPGATDIVIQEVVNADFVISSVLAPSKGTVTTLSANALRWNIPALGVSASESATLEFIIRHTAQTGGTKPVNASITYADAEGNTVDFPAPTVTVDCGVVVQPEACPTPVDFSVGGCCDAIQIGAGDVSLGGLGRIIQLDVTIKHVCPGKRVALAAILTEVDSQGTEHQRGMKTMTIPAHHGPACRDVLVNCIHFVVPEDLDVSGCAKQSICNRRKFQVRWIAHYIDTDYCCCCSAPVN